MSEYVVSSDQHQYMYSNEGAEEENWEGYVIEPGAEGCEEHNQHDGEVYIGEDGKQYFQDADGVWYTYEDEGVEEEAEAAGAGADEYVSGEVQEQALLGLMDKVEVADSPLDIQQPTGNAGEQRHEVIEAVSPSLQQESGTRPAGILIAGEMVQAVRPSASNERADREDNKAIRNHPYHPSWLSRIVLDIFFSKIFIVYLSVLLYSAGGLIIMLNLEYSFAALLRLFSPPSSASPLEPFEYFAIYVFFTHVAVSCICVLIDMLKDLWMQHRGDTTFWGTKDFPYSKNTPPVWSYGAVIVATLILPFFWGIIETAIEARSVIEIAQRFANVSVLAALFLVLLCYLMFFCRALKFKKGAYDARYERDDFLLKAKAYRKHPEKMSKKAHWYHASTFLEEFGLDRDTLFYESVVLIVGLAPILSIYAAQKTVTFIGDPPVTWGVIASLGFCCAIILSWLSCLPAKGHWSAYFAIFLVFLLLVLGIVGAVTSRTPTSVIVVVVFFVLAQGLMTRKRDHQLTQKEKQIFLNASGNEATFDPATWVPTATPCWNIWFDPYLCCCKNLMENFFSCCSCWKKLFKPRDPFVVREEKLYARRKVALRTDQKYTLAWWIFFLVILAFTVGLGNALEYNFSSSIAGRSGNSVSGKNPQDTLCKLSFNPSSLKPFSLLDLAFLSALSYSYGTTGDTDFVTWFSDYPQFYRVYPERLPPNFDYATTGVNISFFHYADFSTGFHIITLNENFRGLGLFRSIDEWGAVLALQGAKAIAPLIAMWPERYQVAFVRVSGLYHDLFPSYEALSNVTSYIQGLVSSGVNLKNILVVGDEINGGYAKVLASSIGVGYVALNPPGTKYTLGPIEVNGTQIIGSRSLWSYVDYLDSNGVTYFYPCEDTISMNTCSSIINTIEYLLSTCGDPYGRHTLL